MTNPIQASISSALICVGCAVIALFSTSIAGIRALAAPPAGSELIRTETKVVEGKEPIQRTLIVDRKLEYDGVKVTDLYVKTIQSGLLVTEVGRDQHYVVCSPLLTDVPVGTQLAGWFVILNMVAGDKDGSKYSVIAPLSLEPIVTKKGSL